MCMYHWNITTRLLVALGAFTIFLVVVCWFSLTYFKMNVLTFFPICFICMSLGTSKVYLLLLCQPLHIWYILWICSLLNKQWWFEYSLYCHFFYMVQADKLLAPEFQPSIEQLIHFLPASRQLLMFSATFPVTVKEFKEKYLPRPYIINLMDELTLKGITQHYAFVEERQKVHCLNTLFSKVQLVITLLVYCYIRL